MNVLITSGGTFVKYIPSGFGLGTIIGIRKKLSKFQDLDDVSGVNGGKGEISPRN